MLNLVAFIQIFILIGLLVFVTFSNGNKETNPDTTILVLSETM